MKTEDGDFVENYLAEIREPEEDDPQETKTTYKDIELKNHSQAVTDAFRRCVIDLIYFHSSMFRNVKLQLLHVLLQLIHLNGTNNIYIFTF